VYDATQTQLELIFRALKRLRVAYSKVNGQDLTICDERLNSVLALLGTTESSDILDRPLRARGKPSIIYSKDRRRAVSIEVRLLDLVGGRRDKSKITQAAKKLFKDGSIDWVNSAADCEDVLNQSHEYLRMHLESASQLQIMRIRRNKQQLRRADTTVLAMGIILVDLVEIPELPNSYGIGAHIARLVGVA